MYWMTRLFVPFFCVNAIQKSRSLQEHHESFIENFEGFHSIQIQWLTTGAGCFFRVVWQAPHLALTQKSSALKASVRWIQSLFFFQGKGAKLNSRHNRKKLANVTGKRDHVSSNSHGFFQGNTSTRLLKVVACRAEFTAATCENLKKSWPLQPNSFDKKTQHSKICQDVFRINKSNDQKSREEKESQKKHLQIFPSFLAIIFSNKPGAQWWASREAAGSTWRMMPQMPMPRPFCHGVTVPLGWAEIGRRWTKPTRCWEARNGTSGGRIRWCGRGRWYGECKVLGGKPVLLYLAGCGWRWGDFGGSFFFAAPFFVASGWVGGGFPSNLFQVSSGHPFFGQISGGSSNSRVPGGFSPQAAHG